MGGVMKNQYRLAGVRISVLAAGLSLLQPARASAAVSENTEPSAWTNTVRYGAVVVSNVVGMKACVGVHFPWSSPSFPPPEGSIYLVTGGDPQVSPFAGDYLANGMKNLAFKLNATTNAMSVSVILKGAANDVAWKYPVSVSQGAGTWTTNIIPLALDGGWYQFKRGDGNSYGSQWTQDLASVSYVGLKIDRGGFSNQIATIDSFILAGTGFMTPPATLLSFGDALEAIFGKRNYSDLTAEQKAQDSDKDGMTDVNELLAGTDPNSPNSVFAVTVVRSSGSGVTIRWSCVNGGVYTVSRSTNLVVGTFIALGNGYRLTATQDGYMEYMDETVNADGGPYFYRIVKE